MKEIIGPQYERLLNEIYARSQKEDWSSAPYKDATYGFSALWKPSLFVVWYKQRWVQLDTWEIV